MNHHLLVRYAGFETWGINEFTSIIDNATFPQHKSPITVPLPVNLRVKNQVLRLPGKILGSSHGLICFYGFHLGNHPYAEDLIVLWNPSIRKSVGIVIPSKPRLKSCLGFGVCPKTNGPKIVKIDPIDATPYGYWEVEVYTLSSKVWKKVFVKQPCKSCGFQKCEGVSVKGFIYWLLYGEINSGVNSNFIAKFDLTNEEFWKVYLPDCLLRSPCLRLSKRNECLTVLDYEFYNVHVGRVCNVWMMKDDDVTKSFTNMFSIKSGRFFNDVLEFRKNGDAIIETVEGGGYILQVYDPCLGRLSGDMGFDTGTNGRYISLSICSYMETLLLLDTTTTTTTAIPDPAGARYATFV